MEPDHDPIDIEHINKAAVIRFVRPEKRNPLAVATVKTLQKAVARLNTDKKIKRIIFTGMKKTFAAGADLREVAALDEHTAGDFGRRGQKLMQSIYQSDKTTYAAIDGFCMGGALDLALSCRYRIASPDSFFAHPGARLGIITGWSGTQLLPRLIGHKAALDLLLTGRRVTAKEALRIGLIDEIARNPLAKTLASLPQ